MDKQTVLCSLDKKMMTEFSKRVVERATGRTFHSIHLPFVNTYLDANVLKEVEKDRIIITHAVRKFTAPAGSPQPDLDAIFEETKTVDRLFLKRIAIPSLTVHVRYEEIADIRKQRIVRLSDAVHTVLAAWPDDISFQDAVRASYSAGHFRDTLVDILHMYNNETLKVSHSIRFFPPFNAALNLFADTLFDIMETVAKELVDSYTHRMYKGELDHACT